MAIFHDFPPIFCLNAEFLLVGWGEGRILVKYSPVSLVPGSILCITINGPHNETSYLICVKSANDQETKTQYNQYTTSNSEMALYDDQNLNTDKKGKVSDKFYLHILFFNSFENKGFLES